MLPPQVLVSTIMVWILFQKKQPKQSVNADTTPDKITLPAVAAAAQENFRNKLLRTSGA
jgi:hypothetical protein